MLFCLKLKNVRSNLSALIEYRDYQSVSETDLHVIKRWISEISSQYSHMEAEVQFLLRFETPGTQQLALDWLSEIKTTNDRLETCAHSKGNIRRLGRYR